MEFDNAFEVPLPPRDAWAVLMDIERIAPCMPGAELTEKLDDAAYKGKVGVRLGPVALTFGGTVRFQEVDNLRHTALVKAAGTDSKGRGGANATIAFRVEPAGMGSQVLVHTDLALSGSVAQYGRGVGIIQEVAKHLVQQFATNLRVLIDAQPAASGAASPEALADPVPAMPATAAPVAAAPIAGLWLLWQIVQSYLRRLFKFG